MPKGALLPDAYPDLEREFRILWADHGDAIALQYAGGHPSQGCCRDPE